MNDSASSISTVPGLLAQRVAASPAAVAYQQEAAPGQWEPITWADFGQRVEQLRRGLAAAGLRPGDRLAQIAPVSLEWELLHHAALALGVVVVGLDAHDLPERIANMVEQADVTAIATAHPPVLARLSDERWARCQLTLQLGAGAQPWPAGAKPMPLSKLEALGTGGDAPRLRAPEPDDMATIIFTSGTTGAPKGIAYKHAQLCLAIDAICDAFPFVGPGSRLLCWLPLSNLFQRIVNLAGMRRGAATYLLGDPRRVMEVVRGVAPAVFIGVPRFYEKLYDGVRERIGALPFWQRRLVDWAWETGRRTSPYRQKREPMPPGLRMAWAVTDRVVLRRVRAVMGDRLQCMVTGSAPTPKHLLEEFHALGWLVLEAYGLSENVLPMAMNQMDDFRFGTVGRPLPGNEIVVTDGEVIKVRGPGLFSGYLGEEDRPPFDADGFYPTGDLGGFDSDDHLRLTGRTSELIKTSTGRRVAPAGVEAELRRVPGIDQVALIGGGRKCLVALCTCALADLDEPAHARLVQALREQVIRLNEYERPGGIALLAHPFSIELGELTPNLKLRRGNIEARYADLIEKLYERVDRCVSAASRELVVI
ncbi:MAG: AMP-binding protein [Rubrivivax sp.]|nr:AMP-binding protein [Rubrivivax sp.]